MEITIITASYNCEAYIEETIKSALAQTYTAWEMIIFDDGSTDASRDIIRKYSALNNKIKLLRHPEGKNLGLAATLQKAVSCAKTPYIAFLECDDIWDKNYLKEKMAFIQANKTAAIIYNDAEIFGTASRVKKLSLYYKVVNFYVRALNLFKNPLDLNFPLFRFNPIPSFSCVILRTDLFEQLDFNTPFAPWLDYWLWAQLSFKNKFYFIPCKLTKWRMRGDSFTMLNIKTSGKNKAVFRKKLIGKYENNFSGFRLLKYKYSSGILSIIFKIFTFLPKSAIKLWGDNYDRKRKNADRRTL